MLYNGASKERVHKELLMHQKPDGFWRKEITDDPDSIFFEPSNARVNKKEDLAYTIHHEPLFEAMPELDATRIRRTGKYPKGEAAYLPSEDLIETDLKPSVETLLHEIQHAIQDKSGWEMQVY